MSGKIRVDNKTYLKMILTKIFKGIGVVIVSLMVLYLAFAATSLRVIPSRNLGLVPVKNATFKGGLAPEGAIVVIGERESLGVLGNLSTAFIPQDIAIVRVEAGPNGEIVWAEGVTTVGGVLVDAIVEEEPEGKYLKGNYVVKCIEGCGEPGAGMIVPKDKILGVPIIDKYRVETTDHISLIGESPRERQQSGLQQSGEE